MLKERRSVVGVSCLGNDGVVHDSEGDVID